MRVVKMRDGRIEEVIRALTCAPPHLLPADRAPLLSRTAAHPADRARRRSWASPSCWPSNWRADAAAGSFRSSIETLTRQLPISKSVAVGGVPDDVVGTLATLPYRDHSSSAHRGLRRSRRERSDRSADRPRSGRRSSRRLRFRRDQSRTVEELAAGRSTKTTCGSATLWRQDRRHAAPAD